MGSLHPDELLRASCIIGTRVTIPFQRNLPIAAVIFAVCTRNGGKAQYAVQKGIHFPISIPCKIQALNQAMKFLLVASTQLKRNHKPKWKTKFTCCEHCCEAKCHFFLHGIISTDIIQVLKVSGSWLVVSHPAMPDWKTLAYIQNIFHVIVTGKVT